MATEAELLNVDVSTEYQEEQLQELTDEQLEQLLHDTLLVTRAYKLKRACCVQRLALVWRRCRQNIVVCACMLTYNDG